MPLNKETNMDYVSPLFALISISISFLCRQSHPFFFLFSIYFGSSSDKNQSYSHCLFPVRFVSFTSIVRLVVFDVTIAVVRVRVGGF